MTGADQWIRSRAGHGPGHLLGALLRHGSAERRGEVRCRDGASLRPEEGPPNALILTATVTRCGVTLSTPAIDFSSVFLLFFISLFSVFLFLFISDC